MVDFVWGTVAAMLSVIGYFVGSMLSPHAKAYKVQAQTWQGQYSGLKKQLVEIQGAVDDQDPIIAIGKSFGLDARAVKLLRPYAEKWIQDFIAKQGQKEEGTREAWK